MLNYPSNVLKLTRSFLSGNTVIMLSSTVKIILKYNLMMIISIKINNNEKENKITRN